MGAITAFLSLMGSKVGRALVAALAILGIIGAVFLSGRRSGRRAVTDRQNRQRLRDMRKKAEVDRDVEALDDAELRRRAARWAVE